MKELSINKDFSSLWQLNSYFMDYSRTAMINKTLT